MKRGKSRKRQVSQQNLRNRILAGLFCLAVLFLIVFGKRSGTKETETTGPESTEEATAKTLPPVTSAAETVTGLSTEETTAELPWVYYTDKSGLERRYLSDEEAALREFEWGIPRVDEYGNPVFRQTDDAFPEYEMIRGIDVSAEQGPIDWYKVREARCDFVILTADERFVEHYEGAYALGLQIGVCFPSDADTPEKAREDAKTLLSLIGDRKIDLFTAFVPEEMAFEGPVGKEPSESFFRNADPQKNTEIALAFCDEIRKAGLRPAIYSSLRYEAEMYDMSVLSENVLFWYSDFGGTPATPYPFTAWQYCLTGGIPGINGPVHLDVFLKKPYEETEAEQKIYSYTQFYEEAYQNTSWVNYRRVNEAWNGEWARIKAGGQEFMMFGCGICCLSNAVSTLTGEVIAPDEMYRSTRENASYYPESGRGAVSWDCMQSMCRHYGLTMQLCRKPSDYESFVHDISQAETAVILVNGENDRRLWWYTDGHYVGIWEYDPKTGTVFVTDPSTHYNRLRVSLQDIYHALKTGSSYQYALIRR